MDVDKLKAFLRDRYRLGAFVTGFLLGIRAFFQAPSILDLLAAAITAGSVFFVLVLLSQYLHRGNLKAFAAVLVVSLLVGGSLFLLLVFGAQSCLMAVYSLDYNPIDGKCQVNTYTCTVERPWYKSKCDGEALKDYCERKNFSSDIGRKEKIKMGEESVGFAACKEEGLVD